MISPRYFFRLASFKHIYMKFYVLSFILSTAQFSLASLVFCFDDIHHIYGKSDQLILNNDGSEVPFKSESDFLLYMKTLKSRTQYTTDSILVHLIASDSISKNKFTKLGKDLHDLGWENIFITFQPNQDVDSTLLFDINNQELNTLPIDIVINCTDGRNFIIDKKN